MNAAVKKSSLFQHLTTWHPCSTSWLFLTVNDGTMFRVKTNGCITKSVGQNCEIRCFELGPMSQAPSGLQTQQILYVPVSALMMTSITCFPSIYLLNSSFSNWAICLFIPFFLLPHAAILYTSQAPSGLQTQQILYVPVSALMVTSITCFPSIYLLSNSCSALTSWCDCSLSFLSSSLFLYTRAQGPSGLRTQQILYVPVTALMMTSITCFPSIYLLTLSIFTWITCWNSSVSSLSFSFCLYMSQAPSGLQTQQILYVPVSALMMPSITSFPRTYFLIKVFQSSCLSASIRFLSSS